MKKIKGFFNGRKTTIAAIIGNILIWAVASGKIDQNMAGLFAGILSAWTGVALGHKIKKGEL